MAQVATGGFFSVAMDGEGNFVTTWDESSGLGTVYVQQYDSAGDKIGAVETIVNPFVLFGGDFYHTLGHPDVDITPTGNFVVTWGDSNDVMQQTGRGLFVQRYATHASIEGRYIFYNQSAFDLNNAAANANDDAAIAADKSPYFPGDGVAPVSSATSYSEGHQRHHGRYRHAPWHDHGQRFHL